MSEGTCNKCGEQKDLVVAGCVCGACADFLDRVWADSKATVWVLIWRNSEGSLQPTEGQPVYKLYRNATYAQMKLHWATWSKETQREAQQKLDGESTWSPVHPDSRLRGSKPLRYEGEIKLLSSSWWSKWPGAPFIRPATLEEGIRSELLRFEQIEGVNRAMGAKWGLDTTGRPLDSRWNANATAQAQRAAYPAIRSKLDQLGLLEGSKWDEKESVWRPRIESDGIPMWEADGRSDAPQEPGPALGLSQVAGMADLKEQLMHEVIGPFKDPELYRRYRVSLPNGILFYGPPGCGKTYIARALAEELGWSFQYCRPSDVASPYIHDTVSRIRAVFAAATEKAPSIVFIDEFEAFVPARSELGGHQQYKAEEVNEFLANLEGCAERKVLVIAATNEPEKIDPAVRRSGRFDKLIFIAPPDAEARRAMLDFHLRDRPVEASLDTAGIATVLDGYSASDIKLLVDEASRMALKVAETISSETLLAALVRVPASITAIDVQRYSAFRARG